ncbi:MAG: hypothetical protein HC805_02685 [Alkalinema sp. RL_2_19]|nr:hypothetical protein [Alkalinema sp. RL_2_19]
MVMIASRKNPYIIGRPVSESDRFFDRENLFRFLTDSLPQAQVILLHGQRRIGKSSVLTQSRASWRRALRICRAFARRQKPKSLS